MRNEKQASDFEQVHNNELIWIDSGIILDLLDFQVINFHFKTVIVLEYENKIKASLAYCHAIPQGPLLFGMWW